MKLFIFFSLEFSMNFREADEDGFTDTIDSLKDAITVNSNPLAIAVKFTCKYPVAVEISSAVFNLKDVVLGSGATGMGSLAGGFTLGLDAGVESPIKLGERQKVTATWALTSLKNVAFHFTDCAVDQGGSEVALVKNKCFSTALKVTNKEGTAREQSFTYRTFAAVGATTTTQTIKCGLEICMEDCDLPEKDEECLKDDETEYSSYEFTVAGFIADLARK